MDVAVVRVFIRLLLVRATVVPGLEEHPACPVKKTFGKFT
jgi:hypothetical protein